MRRRLASGSRVTFVGPRRLDRRLALAVLLATVSTLLLGASPGVSSGSPAHPSPAFPRGATTSVPLGFVGKSRTSALTVRPGSDPQICSQDDLVSFTATVSGGTPPYSYQWWYGDGGRSFIQSTGNASYSYAAPGTYAAVVNVTDAAGDHVDGVITVDVEHGDAGAGVLAAFGSESTDLGQAPLTVTFSGSAQNTSGESVGYAWNIGKPWGTVGYFVTSEDGQTISYTFAAPGLYSVQVDASTVFGGIAGYDLDVDVFPAPLGGTVSASTTSGLAPLNVTFTADLSGGLLPYTYSWNFGDGSPLGTTASVSHTYAQAGTYTATLVANDTAGDHTNWQTVITATGSTLLPLSATATASSHGGPVPLDVQFTGRASGGLPPYSYQWDFGDQSPVAPTQNATHTYSALGSFEAELTVKDSAGGGASAWVWVNTTNPSSTTNHGTGALGGLLAPPDVYVVALLAVALVAGVGVLLWRRRPDSPPPPRRGPKASRTSTASPARGATLFSEPPPP